MTKSIAGFLALALVALGLHIIDNAITGTSSIAPRAAATPQHCKPGSVRAYSGINMEGQRYICVPGYYPESQNP